MSNCHYGNYIDYIIRDLLVWTKTTSLFLMIIWDNWFDMQYHWHGKLSKTYLWTVYIQGISMLRYKFSDSIKYFVVKQFIELRWCLKANSPCGLFCTKCVHYIQDISSETFLHTCPTCFLQQRLCKNNWKNCCNNFNVNICLETYITN